MIYFAHAIDRNTNTAQHVAQAIEKMREKYYGGIYIPSAAFNVLPSYMEEIDIQGVVSINLSALKKCGVMVIDYRPGIESWGVPQEMNYAARAKIPMIMKVPVDTDYYQLSVYLRALIPFKMVVESWSEAMDIVNALEGRANG